MDKIIDKVLVGRLPIKILQAFINFYSFATAAGRTPRRISAAKDVPVKNYLLT